MSNLTITFINGGVSINIQANQSDMLAEIVLKYIQKVGIKDIKDYTFLYNSNPINPNTFKSLGELRINNGAKIFVIGVQQKFINICFAIIGRTINIQAERNMKFSDLATKFCTKAGVTAADQPKFLFNSMQMGIDDQRTLEQLSIRDNTRIEVVLLKDVIGA